METKTIKIITKNKVKVCRDKKDNQILALCLAGNANFLVTGDKDLFGFKRIQKDKDR